VQEEIVPRLLNKQTDGSKNQVRIQSLIAQLCGYDAIRREWARKSLVALGHLAVGPLIGLLSDRRQHVRWEAAKALSEMGDAEAAPALVRALEDEDIDVRWLAAVGLAGMRSKCLEHLLSALIARPDSVWLRHGAHHVFHHLVRKELYHELFPMLNALEHGDPEIGVPLAAYDTMRSLGLHS
jgi:HEAT repeat protein